VLKSTFGKGGAKIHLWERWRQNPPLGKVEPKSTFEKGGAKKQPL